MSQRRQQREGQSPTLKDIHAARRNATEALRRMEEEHAKVETEDEKHEEWERARSDFHASIILFYETLKPHLLDNNIYDNQAAVVTELDQGKFYINQLDDFRLSYEYVDDPDEQVGKSGKVSKKERVPHILPPELAMECYDYLYEIMYKLGMTVQSNSSQASNVAEDKADIDSLN